MNPTFSLRDLALTGQAVAGGGGLPVMGGLVSWWKADSFALADGDPVGGTGNEWLDQSGNGNHLVQATAGLRPLFKTNIVNGQPVVRFDGSDDTLDFTNNFAVGAGGLTLVVVIAQSANDGTSFGGSGGTWGLRHGWIIPGYHAFNSDGFGHSDAFATAGASFKMVVMTRAAASLDLSFRENTTARGTPASVYAGSVILNRLGNRSAGNQQLNGDIAEAICYNAALSGAECDSLYTGYLQAKYGLP